jgi:diguanylate cyclase (GGDEF)-like protein
LTVAKSIRGAIARLDIPHAGSPSGRLTLSIGVAVARPVLGAPESEVVKEADEALYDAKRTGRNRVSTAGRGDPPIGPWMPTLSDAAA